MISIPALQLPWLNVVLGALLLLALIAFYRWTNGTGKFDASQFFMTDGKADDDKLIKVGMAVLAGYAVVYTLQHKDAGEVSGLLVTILSVFVLKGALPNIAEIINAMKKGKPP